MKKKKIQFVRNDIEREKVKHTLDDVTSLFSDYIIIKIQNTK